MSIFTGNWFGFGRGAGGGDTGTTTSGGTEYTPGNGYKYHVFTYPNTDTYVQGDDTPGSVEMLLVAGGGGGGSYYGGGGGAGGVVWASSAFTLPSGTYPVTVGDGGAKGPGGSDSGSQGEDTTFGPGTPTPVVAVGGGGGGCYVPGGGGTTGGSGGGKGSRPGGPFTGNAALQPTQPNPTDFNNYGYKGGDYNTSSSGYAPGGGGGAAEDGINGGQFPGGGDGGEGKTAAGFEYPLIGMSPYGPDSSPAGSPTNNHYGGGGGASIFSSVGPNTHGNGGEGGGGCGNNSPSPGPHDGYDGLGGGGGGGHPGGHGDGGSGICVVRYTV